MSSIQAQTADDLGATVKLAEAELLKLDSETVSHRPAPNRWTIKEVIGHLVDSAANNHQRFVRAQFVEDLVFPDYQQNEWVTSQCHNDVKWPELVNMWATYNRHLMHVMKNIPDAALPVRCQIGAHPPGTLQFLVEDYLVHLRHHLAKIAARVNVDPVRLGC